MPDEPIANLEMARIWDGDEGGYRADRWDHYDRSVAGYRRHLLAAAIARPDRAVALDRLRAAMVEHDEGDGVLLGSGAFVITARRSGSPSRS